MGILCTSANCAEKGEDSARITLSAVKNYRRFTKTGPGQTINSQLSPIARCMGELNCKVVVG